MKRHAIAILCSLLTLEASAHCSKAFHLTEKEREILIAKADAGDPKAAGRLHMFFAFSSLDEDKSETQKWLNRGAELGDTRAQLHLANQIIDFKYPHTNFGATPQEAIEKLLTEASKSDASASERLGNLYYDGYFGETKKHEIAREHLLKAAAQHSSSSWELLATMFHRGEGGKQDHIEAYYYICLATQCTHPESPSGKKLWDQRQKIESWIVLEQAEQVWSRIDEYITTQRKYSGRIEPPPFGKGISEKEWKQDAAMTDALEKKHRDHLQKTKG